MDVRLNECALVVYLYERVWGREKSMTTLGGEAHLDVSTSLKEKSGIKKIANHLSLSTELPSNSGYRKKTGVIST